MTKHLGRPWRSVDRYLIGLLAAFSWLAPAVALAARAEWSRGGSDLALTAAQRCTLEVAFTPEETASLREWRVVWVAEATNGPTLRDVLSTASVDIQQAREVRRDLDGNDGARVDTAVFLASNGTAPAYRTARYVFDALSASHTRIAVIPILATGGVISAYTEGIAEASINGGCARSFPPVLMSVGFSNSTAATTYHLYGAYLREIEEAKIRQPSGAIIPIRVLSSSADSAQLEGPLLERVRSGLLEVRNRSGEWTAFPIAWRASGLRRVVPPRLLFQVDRSALSVASGSTLGDSAKSSRILPQLAAALMQAGAVSLEPLFSNESGFGTSRKPTNLAGEPIDLAPLDDWFIATLGLDAQADAIADLVRSTPGVRRASEDAWSYLACTNDTFFSQQWGLQNSNGTVCGYASNNGNDIGVVGAWAQSTGSPNVQLAILDSGINAAHEDFAPGQVLLGPDYVNGGLADDDNGHGTSVAGIAAAVGNNGSGVAGVAWQVHPWAVKVLDGNAGGVASNLSKGINWASGRMIPIINMSLGWSEGSGELGTDGHALLAQSTLNAFKRGLFLVASSGNAKELTGGPFNACPADLDKRVYAVGAFLPNGNRWQDSHELQASDCNSLDPCLMSNFGGFLDILGPGGRLITTTGLGSSTYLELSGCVPGHRSTMAFGGTSASAPYVSGIAALLLSRRSELLGEDIAQVLNRTALNDNVPRLWTSDRGWGIVKANSALNFVQPSKIIAHWGAGPGPYTLGPLQVMDSSLISSRQFTNVPGMPGSPYTTSCMRYRLRANLTWPFAFASDVTGWTRSSGTLAWKDFGPYDYNEQVDTATFVPATFTGSGATVETFVFRVRDALDPLNKTVGWFPTDPGQAHVALTVIGSPAGTTEVGPGSVAARLAVTTLPNPSRSTAKIVVDVPARGNVRALVLDLGGRRLATLVEGELAAGRHEFSWNGGTDNGTHCPAGVYFCRVDCGGISSTTRFIRLNGSK